MAAASMTVRDLKSADRATGGHVAVLRAIAAGAETVPAIREAYPGIVTDSIARDRCLVLETGGLVASRQERTGRGLGAKHYAVTDAGRWVLERVA